MSKSDQMAAVALVVSFLALGFNVITYLSYSSLDEKIEKDLATSNKQLRREVSLAQARLRLKALRSQVAAEKSYDEAAREVKDIRGELRIAFSGAADESQQAYETVDAELETLENQLRSGSAQSINSLERSIQTIADYVKPDPKQECREVGGSWEQFPNACVDSCAKARNPDLVCAQVITMGCDCGQDMCWNGHTCEPI